MPTIIQCPPTEKPDITCFSSENYGSPKGSKYRHGHLISGIVLRCIDSDVAAMDALACADLKLRKYKGNVGVPHFFVSKEGFIRQYIEEEDIAWGFPEQLKGPLDLSTFNWKLVDDNPNTPIDYYTIVIGVEKSVVSDLSKCDCTGLKDTKTYSQLVQLVAWLSETYSIPKTKNYIAFNQQINEMAEEECGECLDSVCFICDVANYCQKCKNKGKTEYDIGTLKYVYGENIYGCLVKMEVSQLAALLRTL